MLVASRVSVTGWLTSGHHHDSVLCFISHVSAWTHSRSRHLVYRFHLQPRRSPDGGETFPALGEVFVRMPAGAGRWRVKCHEKCPEASPARPRFLGCLAKQRSLQAGPVVGVGGGVTPTASRRRRRHMLVKDA